MVQQFSKLPAIKVLSAALLLACPIASHAVLPDNLTINVGDIDADGQDETLILTKRSMRSATDYKLMTWDSVNGFVQITPPEVRTYRGYVEDDPSMRVNANIEPGNLTMNANLSDGKIINYMLESVPVSISGADGTNPTGTGNVETPLVVTRTVPTASNYLIPSSPMRRLNYAATIDNSYYLEMGSVEAAVARAEQRFNDHDFAYSRDVGLALEFNGVVVNLEVNPTNYHKVWYDELAPLGENFSIPTFFKAPGSAGASGRAWAGGRHTNGTTSANAKSSPHELGHALGAGHYMDRLDAMGSNLSVGSTRSNMGTKSVQQVFSYIDTISETDSPGVIYSSPLPPYAMEDYVIGNKNTSINIDVLENDYDGNGDAIHISYVDAVTSNGGSAVISNGIVTYTPAANWQGTDIFTYHVTDSTGISNRTGYIKVVVHDDGLASHFTFDATSGTTVTDSGPFQAHGELVNDMTFSSNDGSSVTGVVGNALARTVSGDNIEALAEFHDVGDPMAGDLSVSLWVKFPVVPTTNTPIIQKGGAFNEAKLDNPRSGWTIALTEEGKFRFVGNTLFDVDNLATYQNGQFNLDSDNAIQADTWYHLAMVIDRDTGQLSAWVNNQALTTTTFGTTIYDHIIESHHPLTIFEWYKDKKQVDSSMTIDEVLIYTKPLSSSEVSDLYNNPGTQNIASDHTPETGYVDVALNSSLTWLSNPDASDYEVYFGTDQTAVATAGHKKNDQNGVYMGKVSTTSYTPTLDAGTRYYWRIDAKIGGSSRITGDVWWFDTLTPSVLSNPPIKNGSAEDETLASGAMSSDITEWFDALNYTNTQHEDSATHPETPYGFNWIELGNGRWVYQQIGTYLENVDLDVSFILGTKTDTGAHDVTVHLLTGGDPALAADTNAKISSNPLINIVGASLITSSAVITPPSSGSTAEHTVTLSTGSGYTVGEPLWLQISVAESSGRTLVDNIQVSENQ